MPTVTASGLAILTRDKRIQTRTSEISAVRRSGARMFAITSQENLYRWGLLEVAVTRWRDMEEAATEPGPYVYSVTRTGMHKIDLDG